MELLRIAELEKSCGLPRSAIYHYQRMGLLPPVHRSGGSPAVYGRKHVQALLKIRELKAEGLSIKEIRRQADALGSNVDVESLDLVARQHEATRRRILEAAAREFSAKGYRGARLSDIVSAVGIATPTFYRFFPGKRELFIEVVETLVESGLEDAEQVILAEPDLAKRHLMRASGFLSLRNMSPGMLTFLRAEALGADERRREMFRRVYRLMAKLIGDDLRTLRRLAASPPNCSDEMMAYALNGAIENSAMRLSWDRDYSTGDYLWTNLEVFLAIRAVYLGPADIQGESKEYARFIQDLDAHPPFSFAVPEG
jgi:AcrR family transcriptional regulator/predicted DNA-binding transcriptional regulator AlpA